MANFSLCSGNNAFTESLDLLLKCASGVGAIVLFIIGYNRYNKDQSWKRHEFLAKEIKEFNSDPMAKNAMFILDWGTRRIELFPEKEKYEDRFAKVDRSILNSALLYHEDKIKSPNGDRFTPVEVAIRDTFDRFLYYFERFEQLIIANLITEEKLKPYINYWLWTISTELEEQSREALYNFIKKYNYFSTRDLLLRFGISIEPKKK